MLNRLKGIRTDTVSSGAIEQRRGPRHAVHAAVTFQGEGWIGNGRTSNVSAWGCAVESGSAITPGAYVGVHLSLPNETTPLEVELAAVRWCRPRQFGVEFLSLSKANRRRLEHFLEGRR